MNSSVRDSTPAKTLRGIRRHSIESERRQAMIAEAAYYFSEHRGFDPGHELDDWLAAENQIDAAFGIGETSTLADRRVARE